MATLEEIAKQLEDALAIETGTTIAPGTINPLGTSLAGGKKKLSWPETVKKLQNDAGLGITEIMPDLPKTMSATSFYRAGIKSGLLPSGMTTFMQRPFSSSAARTGISSEVAEPSLSKPATPEESQVQGFATPAKRSDVETPTDPLDSFDISETLDSYTTTNYVSTNELVNTLQAVPYSPVQALGTVVGLAGAALGSKDVTHTYDVSNFSNAALEAAYNNGDLNDNQLSAVQQGITTFDINGNPLSPIDGRQLSTKEEYFDEVAKYSKSTFKGRVFSSVFGDFDPDKAGFTPGYDLLTGHHTDKFGNVAAMGHYQDFVDFMNNDPVGAANYAMGRGRGGIGGLDPQLFDNAMQAQTDYLNDLVNTNPSLLGHIGMQRSPKDLYADAVFGWEALNTPPSPPSQVTEDKLGFTLGPSVEGGRGSGYEDTGDYGGKGADKGREAAVALEWSLAGEGDTGGEDGGDVSYICSAAYANGVTDYNTFRANCKYGIQLRRNDPYLMKGYDLVGPTYAKWFGNNGVGKTLTSYYKKSVMGEQLSWKYKLLEKFLFYINRPTLRTLGYLHECVFSKG